VESKRRIQSKYWSFFIDAHADLHSPYRHLLKYSRNAVISCLGDDNLSCQNNEVPLKHQQHWEDMKNIGYKDQSLKI
jgi:arginase